MNKKTKTLHRTKATKKKKLKKKEKIVLIWETWKNLFLEQLQRKPAARKNKKGVLFYFQLYRKHQNNKAFHFFIFP